MPLLCVLDFIYITLVSRFFFPATLLTFRLHVAFFFPACVVPLLRHAECVLRLFPALFLPLLHADTALRFFPLSRFLLPPL